MNAEQKLNKINTYIQIAKSEKNLVETLFSNDLIDSSDMVESLIVVYERLYRNLCGDSEPSEE